MEQGNQVVVRQEASYLPVAEVKAQIDAVAQMMKSCMIKDEHYGAIPGCGDKPVLLKAGAEKLCVMFRLAPSYEIKEQLLENGHVSYTITCTLKKIGTGVEWGQGIGFGSTKEPKWRYVERFEDTGESIPSDYKQKKAEYRAQGLVAKKDDKTGQWMWMRTSGKQERPDIDEIKNTVLKMTKKRALVDATLTATAASDIFTQDVDEDHPIGKTEGEQGQTGTQELSVEQRAKNFAMVFEDEAGKSPLDKKQWDKCRLEFIKMACNLPGTPVSSTTLTPAQFDTLRAYVESHAGCIRTWISSWIDKQGKK